MSAQPLQNANTNAQAQGEKPLPAFLQKKGLLGGAGRGMGSIVSPTDNVLSPCSAKLSGAKQRHFQKAKAVGLTSQLSQLASAPSQQGENAKPKVDF
ncbi:hypothetical protein EHS25_004204 [Saitozyma podzolica]|uniref:Uncharacterized protein n=1 Tax=Saitozyma podzolica TaxID=1890683 RepID=A0A427YTT2_9TREE|nr:hypothetical protein EHS25_004204 [Saitozyma podzolica]